MKPRSGVASGVLMVLAGMFMVLRTVRRPDGGRNLVDLILGAGQGNTTMSGDPGTIADPTSLPALTPRPQTPVRPRGKTTTNRTVPATGAPAKSVRDSA